MEDVSVFKSQLLRFGQYTGLAKDAMRLRMANETSKTRARELLVQRMRKLRGLPQKLGQMMSFATDPTNNDENNSFDILRENAEPLPKDCVVPLLESAWQKPLRKVMRRFDIKARAASIGQVHQAVLRDGREVAVKVQYPGIRDAIQADLKMLGWLSIPVGGLRRGFDLHDYQQVIMDGLDEELDYKREASRHQAFLRWTQDDPFVVIPRIVEELSDSVVLVSEWEDGETWEQVLQDWDDSSKRDLATGLSRFFLRGLFSHGIMQADWHPGNVRFRRIGNCVQMVMYDLGCVYEPKENHRMALARLIHTTQSREESPWPLFLELGFDGGLLEPLAAKLPALCRVLFEPFCVDYPYSLVNWRLGERVNDILANDRWNFRIAGPADLLYLMRAFHGLKYYLVGLGVPTFWKREFEVWTAPLRDRWRNLSLSQQIPERCDFSQLSRHLKIRVSEGGQTKVELTHQADRIDHLHDLLDDELRSKIERNGHDLRDIVGEVRKRGYTPGPVFGLRDGSKSIDVWLV